MSASLAPIALGVGALIAFVAALLHKGQRPVAMAATSGAPCNVLQNFQSFLTGDHLLWLPPANVTKASGFDPLGLSAENDKCDSLDAAMFATSGMFDLISVMFFFGSICGEIFFAIHNRSRLVFFDFFESHCTFENFLRLINIETLPPAEFPPRPPPEAQNTTDQGRQPTLHGSLHPTFSEQNCGRRPLP